eukprot:11056110-Prorocentrum_lima.AAC.1
MHIIMLDVTALGHSVLQLLPGVHMVIKEAPHALRLLYCRHRGAINKTHWVHGFPQGEAFTLTGAQQQAMF